MGDYLDTLVCKYIPCYDSDSTQLVLSPENGLSEIQFELPITIKLTTGDMITFYSGNSSGLKNHCITHNDYTTAMIFINNPPGEKRFIARLDAADMRLLEQVKRDYRKD